MSGRSRTVALAVALVAVVAGIAWLASGGDDHAQADTGGDTSPPDGAASSSGAAPFAFEVVLTADALPPEVFQRNPHDKKGRTILESAHGGFALDPREGKGEVYWFLQGAGILRVDAAVTTVDLLDSDPTMVRHNLHNATFFMHGDKPRIAWPANLGRRVFVTDLTGAVQHDIGVPTVDPYAGGAKYKPTDTAYANGKLWVADGYGSHHVLAYDLDAGAWTGEIFAGTSKRPEQELVRTPHGLTADADRLYVVGRWYARLHVFNSDATFAKWFRLPKRSKPCDIEFFSVGGQRYGVVPTLEPPKGEEGAAAIYIVDMATEQVVSTINPKDDLGLSGFAHHHNALPRVVDGRVYLYDQAYGNGDFAVLRQTM